MKRMLDGQGIYLREITVSLMVSYAIITSVNINIILIITICWRFCKNFKYFLNRDLKLLLWELKLSMHN